MPDELPRDISVVFEKNDHARTFPVTGAWGGPSPDGQSIVVHLYTEYNSTPNSIKADVQEDGSVNVNTGERIARGDLLREIQGTMVLTPQQAIGLGKWLIDKGQQVLGNQS
ncbi:MAG: hypothetical protein U5K69_17360 [Balneolaceae bacterium]|nr:hypothetical protein [Balneolaceae bacterium]